MGTNKIKKAGDTKVVKKRNGRYTVKKRGGGLVNGEEKVKILVGKGLVKQPTKKAPAEAPAEG